MLSVNGVLTPCLVSHSMCVMSYKRNPRRNSRISGDGVRNCLWEMAWRRDQMVQGRLTSRCGPRQRIFGMPDGTPGQNCEQSSRCDPIHSIICALFVECLSGDSLRVEEIHQKSRAIPTLCMNHGVCSLAYICLLHGSPCKIAGQQRLRGLNVDVRSTSV